MSLLEKAELFILNNARLLERQLFAYHFKNGSREAVLAALKAYQNSDKGFGNALEPDKRTASSQPIDQEFALRILDDLGLKGDFVQDICSFITSITRPDGGIPFVLESVADAPRAPWWNTEPNPSANINPTASIAGLLHKHKINHAWLSKATSFCWSVIESLEDAHDNDLICILLFLEHAPDQERANEAFKRIGKIVLKHSALDLNGEGYVHPPYAYAPTPSSLAYQLYKPELMKAHLEALVKKQQEDGGWKITWPPVSPSCELEYRAIVTLNHLKILKAYGYL